MTPLQGQQISLIAGIKNSQTQRCSDVGAAAASSRGVPAVHHGGYITMLGLLMGLQGGWDMC